MNYVRLPSMYRPRKEMKARNNMRKCVQRTQLQILRRIQNKKKSKAQQMYKMTDTQIPGKKKFQRTIQKKFLSKDGKRKKNKIAETKIVELFTVLIKILITSCARK